MIEWYILGIPWEYHDICGSAMVFWSSYMEHVDFTRI